MPLSFGPLSYSGLRTCSRSLAPKSAGVGKADFWPVDAGWPTSFAYSASTTCTLAFGSVARCQTPRKTASSRTERTAAMRREAAMASGPADGEALHVGLGLRRIERLLHHAQAFAGCRGGRQARLLHQADRVGGENHFARYFGVVDLALDLAPALHLRQDPDGEGVPGEGVEVDAVGYGAHVAEAVGEGSGQHLLDHGHRLVQVVGRRDRFGHLLAVLRLARDRGGVDDRL